MSLLTDLLNLDLSDCTGKIIAEYIWVGGTGMDVRSKARVICDCYSPTGEPIPSNKRCNAERIFSHPDVKAEEPWYGIEQEYTLLQKDTNWPIGWPLGGYPGPQGPYYCAAGADKSYGRDIVDAHYKACLYAGINIGGINAEVMPGQWEFQVGPSVGISAGDQLWAARYILERITEIAGVVVSFDPKPIPVSISSSAASFRKDFLLDLLLRRPPGHYSLASGVNRNSLCMCFGCRENGMVLVLTSTSVQHQLDEAGLRCWMRLADRVRDFV
ncbi:hypothetical protein ACQ4PT_022842 [Festuca glaucescens]